MRIAIGMLAGWAWAACSGAVDRSTSSDAGGSVDPGSRDASAPIEGGTGADRDAGGSDASAPITGVISGVLSIDPPAPELVIANGIAATAQFTAMLTTGDGAARDVTAETSFIVDGSFGVFTGNALTVSLAGQATVFAAFAGLSARAEVTARARSVRVDPSLPSTTPALFAGPDDASRAPQIVYPPAGTAMPRNLGDFELHWIDRHASTVFELSLRTELTDVRIYVPGGNGLPAQGPMASWSAFQPAEWLAPVGPATAVTYQVRGVDAAAPGSVGATPPVTVQLSSDAMEGGLYYWATISTTNVSGIFRHDMSRPGQPAEEFLTTNQTGGRCVACHVVSRDGAKLAVTYEDADLPGPATLIDVPTRALAPEVARWNFGTFTPDDTQLLAVEQGTLVVRDTATQAVLATMPTAPAQTWVTQPELSADGTQLVYVRPGLRGTDFEFKLGEIYVRSYDRATRTFGPERLLIGDGQNNFSPSWSPDGAWIAFNKTAATDTSYDDNLSSTWVVRADGAAPPIALALANQASGLTNSAVRWAPFAQTLGTTGEPMFWLTMSSKRDFGVRLRNTGLPQRGATGKRAQLWMTPVFPARAQAGQDPSLPAFRLPFQNLESSNQTAQWTERVVDGS
jgi:hypothetical protein